MKSNQRLFYLGPSWPLTSFGLRGSRLFVGGPRALQGWGHGGQSDLCGETGFARSPSSGAWRFLSLTPVAPQAPLWQPQPRAVSSPSHLWGWPLLFLRTPRPALSSTHDFLQPQPSPHPASWRMKTRFHCREAETMSSSSSGAARGGGGQALRQAQRKAGVWGAWAAPSPVSPSHRL